MGFDLATNQVSGDDFNSRTSLLDWDIVLFKPDASGMLYSHEKYQGKTCVSDTDSFALKNCCEDWRREIKQAVDTGKTVIVFLSPLTEVYVDTGNREYSGTGRNRRASRVVDLYSNYESIPAKLQPVTTSGSSMKLVARGAEFLLPYWSEFEAESTYEVLLTAEKALHAYSQNRAIKR